MHYVTVVGSGNVGANTAFFIAEKGITDVALYDIREGLAMGKGLDMMEAAPLRGYRNRIRAADSLEVLGDSETVVLAAGKVRTPGMEREDLFQDNRGIVAELAPEIARRAPHAKVVVATEPVDLITAELLRLSRLPRKQVIGIGGFLDVTRLRYLLARELGLSPENISALAIGRHSKELIIPLRYCSVSGLPITALLPQDQLAQIVEETRGAGDRIVSLAQRASAFYAPSAAAADVVDAIHTDLHRVLCLSVLLQGEYGIEGVAMSLPVVVGRAGVERVLTPALTPDETKLLEASARRLSSILGGRA